MAQRDPDEYIRNLRKVLITWKQNQLSESIQEAQETTKLNDYLKLTALAHEMLKNYINSNGKLYVDPLLREVVVAIGEPSKLSSEEKMLVEDYLFRDLIEYPFTYNTVLINSFQTRNILNTNIIPNK